MSTAGTSELETAARPILGMLPPVAQAELLCHALLHRVAPGTILFEQGETPNFQHVVVSGSIHLLGRTGEEREVLIDVVGPPDLIIPAAVVGGAPYLMRGRAPETTRLLLIQADAFRTAVVRHPALAQLVIASLSGQFRRLVRQIKNLKLRSTTERVGCYLLMLSRRQGTPDRAVLPYEKNLVASELGMTRESFSRALAALHPECIAVEGETIHIHDAARLAATAGHDPLIDQF